MDNESLLKCDFLSNPNSPLTIEKIRVILSYPIINFVSQYFVRTRDYEGGLYFVGRFSDVIENNTESIPPDELDKWRRYLIFTKLCMLDYLNRWEEYMIYSASTGVCNPYRHPVIKRKLEKAKARKTTDHLLRHQSDRLTAEKQQERFNDMMRYLTRIINQRGENHAK